MQIRPATAADRQLILALMRPGDYNRINLQPNCFKVAEAPNSTDGHRSVIGIGQVKRHWDGTPELASLVVAKAYRHQGVGGAIVRALVDQHFADEPNEPLYLFCLSTLESYYRQFGFRRLERVQLPWSLWLMHLLGNGLGRMVSYLGTTPFAVIAMKLDGILPKHP